MLSYLDAFCRWTAHPGADPPVSESELVDYWDANSICGVVGGRLRAVALSTAVVACLVAIGALLSVGRQGTQSVFGGPLLQSYFVNVLLYVYLCIWTDSKLKAVIVDTADAFENESAYFRAAGEFLERIYEPTPWAAQPATGTVHPPTVVLTLLLAVAIAGVWHTQGPASAVATGPGGATLAVTGYYLLLLVVLSVLAAVSLWEIFLAVVFLGYRIGDLDVRLDLSTIRTEPTLGFQPFVRLMLGIHVWYFGILLLNIGLFLTPPSLLKAGVFLVLSVVPVIGFSASQYGPHRAIVASKQRRLRALEAEYRTDLEDWLRNDTPDEFASEARIQTILRVERELDDIPDWPINLRTVGKVASGSLVSVIATVANLGSVVL